MPLGSPALRNPSKKAYISGNNTIAVIPIARASRKPIRIEHPIKNKNEDVKYPKIKIKITWMMTAMETNSGFQVKKSILIRTDCCFVFFKNDSNMSKQDKRIIQPNKNRGNNSPPAGKLRLSKPKNTDKQINDNDVK